MKRDVRLFDANLYRFDTPQRSYWEATAGPSGFDAPRLETTEQCDVAIIGAGYTGLSAALHLARDYGEDVRVVEAGHVGWGASGRNGGFCCPGGTGIRAYDLVRWVGEKSARAYYAAQRIAVALVRELGREESIDFDALGEAELEVAHTERAFRRQRRDRDLLSQTLGIEAELVPPDAFRERYFDSTEQFGGLVTRPAFGLHPLRYCHGLAAAACRRGVRLHGHSEVIEWTRDDNGRHRLTTAGGALIARRVVFATNGFMPENLRPEFAGRTLPVISAILVTRPLTDDERQAQHWQTDNVVVSSRNVLNYFRLLPDGRLLFGGRGDINGTAAGEARTYDQLERALWRIWPAWKSLTVDYRWHGLICMTATLRPSVGRLEDDASVYFAFGYHGNGVNNATWAGRQIADWMGTGRVPDSLPDIVRGLAKRYPFPGLRRPYLRFALAVGRQADRFG